MAEELNMAEIRKELRKKKFKAKVEEVKETVSVGLRSLWSEHGEEIKKYGPAALAGAAFLGKELVRSKRTKDDFKFRTCRHYDRRSDEYVFSKRPLKTSEKKMLERMYAKGMSKLDALEAMGLLRD